jgi:hypothetical protein
MDVDRQGVKRGNVAAVVEVGMVVSWPRQHGGMAGVSAPTAST